MNHGNAPGERPTETDGAPQPSPAPPEAEDLARQLLTDAGAPEVYAPQILAWSRDRSDVWRQCCGHLCDPCMLTLGRIVDEVREAHPAG